MSSTPKPKRGLHASAAQKWDKLFKLSSSSSQTTQVATSRPGSPTPPPNSSLAEGSQAQPSSDVPKDPSIQPSSLPEVDSLSTLQDTRPSTVAYHPTAPPLNGLNAALKSLHKGAGVFPPLQAAIGGVISCVETMEMDSKYRKEYEDLVSSLSALSELLTRHLQEAKSARMSEFIERMAISVSEQTRIISEKRDRSRRRYLAENEQDEDDILSAYRRIEALFRQLQADANLSIWSIANEHLVNTRLEAMSPSKSTSYNSILSLEVNRRACTRDTRVQVLSELDSWSRNPDAPNIYWMNGMAGTGKTTIAYTFADTLKSRKALGASFFCTRTSGECRDVGRIIPTIAYQLARYSTPFQSALAHVLGNDPDIGSRTIANQFERLIKEPLLSALDAIPAGLVVVIDALDECSNAKGIGMILDVLFSAAPGLPLKFFITSRPEPSIRRRVQNRPDGMRSVYVLHEIEKSLVQADIELYLREELVFMTTSHLQLKRLAELSGCLFIYAATAIRYIYADGMSVDHEERLETILDLSPSPSQRHAEIDNLYSTILVDALENPSLEKSEKDQMRLVLWTTVCAREPVDVETLAALAGIKAPKASILLQSLFSVLHVSKTSKTISTLHASFPDFIFDKIRSLRFCCDQEAHNRLLAEQCFNILKQQLRFNICGLESSFKYDDEVDDLQARMVQAISPTLSYAAYYWGDHLGDSPACELLQTMLRDFLSNRLLFWMEVLNLKSIMNIGITTLLTVRSWLTAGSPPPDSDLVKSLDDSWLFLTRFAANPISQSTPHIYISALPYCYRSNSVYNDYWKRTRQLLVLEGSAIEQNHTALLATWKVDSDPLSLAFSSDSTRIAIGFKDGTVISQDAHTGNILIGPLRGHTDWVKSIAFSPDGSKIASGSDDHTIIVWDAYTGARIVGPLLGHNSDVMSVCFSPDGGYVLSGSFDCTTSIWDSRSGCLVPGSLQKHPGPVYCAAFSPDGKHVACGLGGYEFPLILYDASTGIAFSDRFRSESRVYPIMSLKFFPDGKRIITGSHAGDICIWNVEDGALSFSHLEGQSGTIASIAFSPDGNRIAIGHGTQNRHDVYYWNSLENLSTGNLLGRHDEDVQCVVFSSDGARVVSCSDDGTIKVWGALHSFTGDGSRWKGPNESVDSVAFSPDGSCIAVGSRPGIYVFDAHDGTLLLGPFVGHNRDIRSLAFSSDRKYIASGGEGGTICLWDATTGTLLSGPLEAHPYSVSVEFSPDGKRLISASGLLDCTIRIWHIRGHSLTPTDLVINHSNPINCLSFSPNGEWIAAGSSDGTVCVWDSQTLSLAVGPFRAHWQTNHIYSIAFSPDSRLIASGCHDNIVCVFNSFTGDLVSGPFEGHSDSIFSVVFSPDGNHIVSGSLDQTIRVWRVEDGALQFDPLEGHTGAVKSVHFSPNGAYIVSGSWDSTVRAWYAPNSIFAHNQSKTTISYPAQGSPHHSVIAGLALSKDGWVRNRNSELLFWVPPDLVKLFPNLRTVFSIGAQGVLRTDYSKPLFLGRDWHRCYIP
ncbi:unnamed protein product [Rhizoctonia solani]|uniref:NACHT domain-containing protein n=1 Tax=Rhizoctonia solani TaxID=456999 RepID=A0A8H2ZVJ1_9AGAM|nr:unnamed protein product [Rhizoctonia solani]